MVYMHCLLERRVPDRATRQAQATLRALAPRGPLPSELMEHCAAQVSATFEWLPCRYDEWLTMGDDVFARVATTFYEARAASILSRVTKREIPADETKPSLWPMLGEWRKVAERGRIPAGIDWSADRDAQDAVGMAYRSLEVFCDEPRMVKLPGAYRAVAGDDRRECQALFSSYFTERYEPNEGIEVLPCVAMGYSDAHPSYLVERGYGDGHCNLAELLATDWDAVGDALGRTRRALLGEEALAELRRLGAAIAAAGLPTRNFRLLVWFGS